jgi:integrase
MKVVQGFLGHSDYRLTANTYSHIPDVAQRDLAARIDSALNA